MLWCRSMTWTSYKFCQQIKQAKWTQKESRCSLHVSFYFQSLSALVSPRKEQQRLSFKSLRKPPVLQQKIQQKNSKGRPWQVWRLKTSPVCRTPSICSKMRGELLVATCGKGQGRGEKRKKKMTQNYINWLSYENKVELGNNLGNKTPTNVVLKIIIKPNQTKPQTPLASTGSWDISVFRTERGIFLSWLFLKLC